MTKWYCVNWTQKQDHNRLLAVVDADSKRKAQNVIKRVRPQTAFGGKFSPSVLTEAEYLDSPWITAHDRAYIAADRAYIAARVRSE